MTISTTTSRADYTGNGVTTAFTVPFYFLDNTHLTVLRTQISTGVVTTLVLNSDYTVTGAGVAGGGTATMAVAPTSDQKLSILRNVPFTQTVHYVPNDPFPAATHEQALDKLTMEVQQLGEQASRALTLNPNTTAGAASTTLPTPSAATLIGWSADATSLVNYTAASLAISAVSSTWTVFTGTGTGAQTVFTLASQPPATASTLVFVGGVAQTPGVDFTIGTNKITFTTAPPNGVSVMVQYGVPLTTAAYLPLTGGTLTGDLGVSGKIGVNGAPSAWTNLDVVELPGGAVASQSGQIGLWQNTYYNGGSFRYKASAAAALYQVAGGTHVWSIAPSGGAGNIATFTQAMVLDANSNLLLTGGGGLGYGTGSGGTVTQLTSKSTAVTLNKPSGRITMNNAALAAGTAVAFIVNNSLMAASDTAVVTLAGGNAGTATYRVWAEATGLGGQFMIVVENRTGGSLSEALVLTFAVIKGAVS